MRNGGPSRPGGSEDGRERTGAQDGEQLPTAQRELAGVVVVHHVSQPLEPCPVAEVGSCRLRLHGTPDFQACPRTFARRRR